MRVLRSSIFYSVALFFSSDGFRESRGVFQVNHCSKIVSHSYTNRGGEYVLSKATRHSAQIRMTFRLLTDFRCLLQSTNNWGFLVHMSYCSKRCDTYEKRFSVLYKKDRSTNMLSPVLAAQMRSQQIRATENTRKRNAEGICHVLCMHHIHM